MPKPPNTDAQDTHIVGREPTPSDLDALMTTVRTQVAGTLVITDGPGKGQTLSFYEGSNSIGRDRARNVIALDFGDATIHRDPHAYLTCSKRVCTLMDTGQQNPVKINGKMLSGTAPVGPGDVIAIGKTTLQIEIA